MLAISHSVISRRGTGAGRGYGLGALPTCPSADVSSSLKLVNYCNISGVGLTACPGQDLASIQSYNMQLQVDANNALNQCNCNNAYVLNGQVGPNNCASMYPVSGQTSVVSPNTPPVVPSGTNAQSSSSSSVQSHSNATGSQVASTQGVPTQSTTPPSATTGTSSTSTSTNATSQTDTSGDTTGLSLSGFQIIVGVIGVGLALMALQKGH